MNSINYRKAEEHYIQNHGWNLSKLKYFITTKSGEILSGDKFIQDGLYPVYGANGEIGRYNKRNVVSKSILIGRVGACGEINIGSNLWASDNVLIVKIISKDINFNYLYYLLLSKNLPSYASKTAQPLITGTLIRNLYCYKPSCNEQQKIANFLDIKTVQFDSIIAKKELLIQKLEEAKKSLISEVVTGKVKIIDGKLVPRQLEEMKDSGVEWLGRIPNDWEVTPIKRLFKIKKKPIYKENSVVLSLTQRGLKIKDLQNNEGQHASSYSGYQEVLENDFVMNHMDLLTGFVDCSTFIGVTSPDYRVFSIINSDICCKEFYLYYFQMCYKNKIFYGYGQGVSYFGRWRLQTEVFYYFPVVKLDYHQQVNLAQFIDAQVNSINNVIKKLAVEITLIKQAKQSLISEAVTGKIDLRDWEIIEEGEVQ